MSDVETEGSGTEGADEMAVVDRWFGGETEAAAPEPEEPAAVDPPEVDPPEQGERSWAPSRDEWEATQDLITDLAGTLQEREQAEIQEAQLEAWLGDPESDPDGYEERLAAWYEHIESQEQTAAVQALIDARVDDRLGPLDELVQEHQYQEALDAAAVEVERLLGDHEAEFGQFDHGEAQAQANKVLQDVQVLLVREHGFSPEAAEERAMTPEAGMYALRTAAWEAAQAARPRGDEMSLVERHVGRGTAPAAPRSAVQEDAKLREILSLTTGLGPYDGSWIRPKEMG